MMQPIDPIRHVVILLDPSVIEIPMPEGGGYFLKGNGWETGIYLSLVDCYESAYAKLVWAGA